MKFDTTIGSEEEHKILVLPGAARTLMLVGAGSPLVIGERVTHPNRHALMFLDYVGDERIDSLLADELDDETVMKSIDELIVATQERADQWWKFYREHEESVARTRAYAEESKEAFGGRSAGTLGKLTDQLGQRDVEDVVSIAEEQLRARADPELLDASRELRSLLLFGYWGHALPQAWKEWHRDGLGCADPSFALLLSSSGTRALSMIERLDGPWVVQSVSSAGVYKPISEWPIGNDIPIAERQIFVAPIEAPDVGRFWPLCTEKIDEPRNEFAGYVALRVDAISHAQVLAEFGEKVAACAREDRDSLVLTIERLPDTVRW